MIIELKRRGARRDVKLREKALLENKWLGLFVKKKTVAVPFRRNVDLITLAL